MSSGVQGNAAARFQSAVLLVAESWQSSMRADQFILATMILRPHCEAQIENLNCPHAPQSRMVQSQTPGIRGNERRGRDKWHRCTRWRVWYGWLNGNRVIRFSTNWPTLMQPGTCGRYDLSSLCQDQARLTINRSRDHISRHQRAKCLLLAKFPKFCQQHPHAEQ